MLESLQVSVITSTQPGLANHQCQLTLYVYDVYEPALLQLPTSVFQVYFTPGYIYDLPLERAGLAQEVRNLRIPYTGSDFPVKAPQYPPPPPT